MTTEFWRAKYARECIKRFHSDQLSPFILRTPSLPAGHGDTTRRRAPPSDRPPLHPIPFPCPILTGDTPHDGDKKRMPRESPGDIVVGIIGAGAAGLYAAMILDDLGIKYEILEGSNRPGGRIYTHQFDSVGGGNGEWNYFDVGAMRYPKTPVMWRVFDLFEKRLNIGDRLVNYIMNSDNQFLNYNSRTVQQKQVDETPTADWFGDSEPSGGLVPDEYVKAGVSHWLGQCFDPFKEVFKRDWDEGMKALLKYDKYSARMFMAKKFTKNDEEENLLEKEAYPDSVINWLERMNTGTGLFDMAFSEMVIDDLQFDYPTGGLLKYGADAPKEADQQWYCLRSGSKIFIDKMVSKLSAPIQYQKRVTSIVPTSNPNEASRPLSVTYTTGQVRPIKATTSYNYVISTIPLPALRYVDLDSCNLSYAQREGMRSLRYDSSCKVGIKFATRWWQNLPSGGIYGGQCKTDRVTRTVVFPSYGVDDPNADAVMIASYTWSQDASRIGGLCQGRQHPAEKILIEGLLEDIALIHGVTFEFLSEQCVDWYAFDWYNDPFALGAFALFGPGQFSNIYSAWGQGAAGGRLIFAGEALSEQHAWVVGALNSAYDAVYKMLVGAQFTELLEQLKVKWGNHTMRKEEEEEHEDLLKDQEVIGAVFSTISDYDDVKRTFENLLRGKLSKVDLNVKASEE